MCFVPTIGAVFCCRSRPQPHSKLLVSAKFRIQPSQHSIDDTPQNLTIPIGTALRRFSSTRFIRRRQIAGLTSLGRAADKRYSLGIQSLNRGNLMLKRLLNVFTIVCTIYLLTLIGVMLTGGVSDWVKFIGSNFFPLAGAYLLIVIINYVAYSQITLWHKNNIVKNVHNET